MILDCGICLHCRKKKALDLATRCVLHSSLYKQNCFLTLTYDETKEGYKNVLNYSHVQKFKKRLRRQTKEKIQIFNVHEYGKNGKKHWHLIVFNYDFADKELYTISNDIPLYTSKKLRTLWPFGFNTIGDVSEASAMYQAQYMEKDFKHHSTHNERKSKSNHSGIGKPYFEKHYKQILQLGYIPFGGKKLSIPRYFQKLAKKHWCHFNDPSAFFDTYARKALYRPFIKTEPSIEISRLYSSYLLQKEDQIEILVEEWQDTLQQYLTTKNDPDFIKSLNNNLYDLRNKHHEEKF